MNMRAILVNGKLIDENNTKLFERNGESIVVVKSESDDGNPIISIIFDLAVAMAMQDFYYDSKEKMDMAFIDVFNEDYCFKIKPDILTK